MPTRQNLRYKQTGAGASTPALAWLIGKVLSSGSLAGASKVLRDRLESELQRIMGNIMILALCYAYSFAVMHLLHKR